MAFVKLNDEDLRMRMQEVIDNVASQLRVEAVNTIFAEKTTVPMSADIVIHLGVDMIPTITYTKETYVNPVKVVLSEEWEHEGEED